MGNPLVHAGTAVTTAQMAEEESAAAVVRPGATRPGERRYWRMADGSVAVRELHASPEFGAFIEAPPGGVEVDAETGAALLAEGRDRQALERQAARDTAAGLRAADHAALVALGLAADAASRLTGHHPPSG